MNMYTFSIMCTKGVSQAVLACDMTLRPTKFLTNVSKEGVAIIDGIFIEDRNQLMQSIDAYWFSIFLSQKLRNEFFQKHKLIDLSDRKIQKYLDDNDLSIPDVPHLTLPILVAHKPVRITGKFEEDCCCTFIGMGR